MSRDEKLAPRRTRLSGGGRVRALLSLGMVLGLGSVGTLAAWSDNAKATTGLFTTGAIDLKLDGSDGPENKPYNFTRLAMVSMAPGRSVAALLPVENRGSIDFNYSANVTAVADPNSPGDADLFAKNLIVKVFPDGSTVSGPAEKRVCSGDAFATQTLSTAGSVNLISSRGPLVTGADENLCIQVEVKVTTDTARPVWPARPANWPSAAQSAELDTVFEFTATAPAQP